MTLTLHNVTLTSQKPCQRIKSVIAAKQTVINEVYSDILLKNTYFNTETAFILEIKRFR